MKKSIKYLLPIAALAVFAAGSTLASANGWFMFNNASPEEQATKQQQVFQHEADMLGISVDEIKQAWSEGKNVKELAQEKGISEDQLKTRMHEQAKVKMQAHLKALVDGGVVTQEQADKRLQVMESRLEKGAPDGKLKLHHGGGKGEFLFGF